MPQWDPSLDIVAVRTEMVRLKTDLRRFSQLTSIAVFSVLICPGAASAQLSVEVRHPKIMGQKAVVACQLKNVLDEKIISAKAAAFLLDPQGKIVGQSTQWVVGGSQEKQGLAPGATNSFSFVITAEKPFTTTNLTAKVSFLTVVLEGGKLANPATDVIVTYVEK